MKRLLLTMACVAALAANAQKTPEWKREYFAKELEKEAWEVEERWE